MNKVATILSAVLIAALAAMKMADKPSPAPLVWMDEQKFQERWQNYQCFKQTFGDVLDSLGKGEISLKEARARVYGAARCFQPDYLERLSLMEPGKTDDERVAQNLVGHLRGFEEFEARTRALDIELSEIGDDSSARRAR